MTVEIERKFLVADTAFLARLEGERLTQGYIASTDRATARVRVGAGSSVKRSHPFARSSPNHCGYSEPAGRGPLVRRADASVGKFISRTESSMTFG